MTLGLHPKNRYEINRGRGPNCDRRPNGAMVCVNVCLSAGCVCICGHTLVHLSPIWAATITAGIDGDDGNVCTIKGAICPFLRTWLALCVFTVRLITWPCWQICPHAAPTMGSRRLPPVYWSPAALLVFLLLPAFCSGIASLPSFDLCLSPLSRSQPLRALRGGSSPAAAKKTGGALGERQIERLFGVQHTLDLTGSYC
jgi:hypothetical protein